MRLDKFLANALKISRTDAAKAINAGQVIVNNEIIRKKDLHIQEEKDQIKYLDEILVYREFIYIMLNKPAGVVSAVTDKYDRTVVDLIDTDKDVFPVGRLDKDVEGLLVLTNNGKLAHRLTSPKQKVYKKYYVKLKSPIENNYIDIFNQGIEITDGSNEKYITKPGILEIIDEYSAFLSIYEGKFHQVKRMFRGVNNEVVYLKRVAMGDIELDMTLALGEYRYLNDQEIIKLKQMGNLKM